VAVREQGERTAAVGRGFTERERSEARPAGAPRCERGTRGAKRHAWPV